MLQRSGGEETRTEVLGKSVDEKCCSEMLAQSVVYSIEVLGKSKETWYVEVVEQSVVEKCCRRSWRKVSPGSVVQECWRRVLWSSVGEECCREMLSKSVVEYKRWGRV